MSRRLAAVLALACLVGGLVLVLVAGLQTFPWGIIAFALVVLSGFAAWQAVIHRGWLRTTSWIVAAMLVVAAIGLLLFDEVLAFGLAGVALLVLALPLGRRAFTVHLDLPRATPPSRPVMVWNPRSGGGKAVRHRLADEARARGIEPIELKPGDDLVALVQTAVADGADGLMAAGGDGTQALVATIAAEHDLPFACIPAGTRNHFALDLGVDRDDVVGALDAFVTGGEKRVDLAEVDGRTFVNNASLGVYAEAVQREGYREAKIRTILDTVPEVLGQDAGAAATTELRWTGPDGSPERTAAVILVSNNAYRLGRLIGSGTRPAMDTGLLGVAVAGATPSGGGRRWSMRQWTAQEFVVEADGDIPIGVDGEALVMSSPLAFRIRPGALRVRIAPQHPGASPSAAQPTGITDALRRLLRIAAGTDPADAGSATA